MRKIDRQGWLMIGAFTLSGSLLAWAAWHGEKWAAVVLVLSLIGTQVILQLTRRLLDSVLVHGRETLQLWKAETTYVDSITNDYVEVLHQFSAHDPQNAAVYQERLATALMKRHPEATAAIEEMQSKADMN